MAYQRNSNSEIGWKHDILVKLQHRNKQQTSTFEPIIKAHTKLLDNAAIQRAESMRLAVEVEKLKQENLQLQIKGGQGGASNEVVTTLEKKIYSLQEELTEMLRKKSESAQKTLELNQKVQEKEQEILSKDKQIKQLIDQINTLEENGKVMQQRLDEETTTREILSDEQQALQLAFTKMEEKFRKLADDNNDLVSRWMALKAKDADKVNAENDQILKAKQMKLQQQLAEAAREHKEISPPRDGITETMAPAVCFAVTVPEKPLQCFDAHEGEVNAVRWSPSGRYFASGGADRKLKLWEVNHSKCENRAVLMGSNAAITAVAFDQEETLVLAASNDFACRVWSIGDHRLRHTLTGHSGKVLSAKFFCDPNKVVSGSHDRTVKVWDLRSKACIKTIFAGSTCNDLVCQDTSSIISGHFDKKIRFWDTRSDSNSNEILLQGRITSLDLSPDMTQLLSCSRDDTLKIIDLRMNTVIKSLGADGFHVTLDYARAVFSPDGHYVAAGSGDGSVYVWNVFKNRVEKVLRQHQNGVICCSWNPQGTSILSSDKHHQVVYWADF